MPKRRNAGAKRNPAASKSMKARTTRGRRDSWHRRDERQSPMQGSYVDQNYKANRQGYNSRTYAQVDVSNLGGAKSGHHGADFPASRAVDRPEYRGGYHPTNFGLRGQTINNPGGQVRSARQSVPETAKQRKYRRQRSTESALRRADASMFNYDG